MIENAQKEVLIQTFLFSKKSIPVQLMAKGIENLEKRLKKNPPKKPVKVKILIDKLTGLLGYLGILPFGLEEKAPKEKIIILLPCKKIDPKLINIEVKSWGHTLLAETIQRRLSLIGQKVLDGAICTTPMTMWMGMFQIGPIMALWSWVELSMLWPRLLLRLGKRL